jgi:hypothetical protein
MGQEKISFLLSKYFSLKGAVVVPGIGLLRREHMHAQRSHNDFVHPPSYTFSFDGYALSPSENQVTYISVKTGFSFADVLLFLDQLGKDISAFLDRERKLDWSGVGVFQKDEDGLVTFHAKTISTLYFKPLFPNDIEKPISDEFSTVIDTANSDQQDLTTSEELLEENGPTRYNPAKFALFIILICMAIFCFRFFMGHFEFLGPTIEKIQLKQPPAQYQKY